MIFFISAPIPKRWTRSKRIKATECVLSHCDDQQTPIFKTCQTKQHKPRIHCFVKLKMISNKFWLIWWLAKHQRKFHASFTLFIVLVLWLECLKWRWYIDFGLFSELQFSQLFCLFVSSLACFHSGRELCVWRWVKT